MLAVPSLDPSLLGLAHFAVTSLLVSVTTDEGEELSLACKMRLSFWSLWALLHVSSVSAPAPWTPAWLTSRSTP